MTHVQEPTPVLNQPKAQDIAKGLDSPLQGETGRAQGGFANILPYVSIARPDHWFKNVFMALGILLALFHHPQILGHIVWWQVVLALAATCLLASSNYVINEILDAPTDRSH